VRGKKVRWRKRALSDLHAFHEWLATKENGKPKQTVRRIRLAADGMTRLGDIGRPGIEPGLRELSVKNAPYVIV
jgi:plasmid stabilization system protein ParE